MAASAAFKQKAIAKLLTRTLSLPTKTELEGEYGRALKKLTKEKK